MENNINTTNDFEEFDNSYIFEQRWEDLKLSLWDYEFQLEDFKQLIRETHSFFLPYGKEETLPKDSINILLRMNEFANHPELINDTIEACKKITESLICEITSLQVSTIYKNGTFYIEGNNEIILFDINEFNINPIIEDLAYNNHSIEDFDYCDEDIVEEFDE